MLIVRVRRITGEVLDVNWDAVAFVDVRNQAGGLKQPIPSGTDKVTTIHWRDPSHASVAIAGKLDDLFELLSVGGLYTIDFSEPAGKPVPEAEELEFEAGEPPSER